ncbi:MAG: hypothetical protein KatS3mg024_2648 [Armatimonadota bacterium]|nr:MAG: hypothetical protein KatS3mg024_2648 [Armatimonadota bacterium]
MKTPPRCVPLLVAAIFLVFAAAMPAPAQRPDEPLPTPDFSNVRYNTHERNVLDLWKAPVHRPAPLLVFIHGGGFVGGDKSRLNAAALKKAIAGGAHVMSINYRYLRHAPIQDILRDCARAIQFIRLHAKEYGVDPDRIACFGSSAGAGASLWLATHDDLADPSSPDPVLRQSSRIRAAACLNGQATYDLTRWEPMFGAIRADWKRSESEPRDFYHFASDADFDTEAGRKILKDCDMLGLLSKDDPPIWMFCSYPPGIPKDRQVICCITLATWNWCASKERTSAFGWKPGPERMSKSRPSRPWSFC